MLNSKLIRLAETDSTNRWLRDYTPAEGENATIVVADYQTAGKGCGANTWESERGKNLLFSMLIHPTDITANEQFSISMVTSLALCDTMREFGIDSITVKWPNDIYWHDRKLCGMLIENRVAGNVIRDSIIGIGLNVNQTVFRSDAPNPVSMRQILGCDIDRNKVLQTFMKNMENYLVPLTSHLVPRISHLSPRYNESLYRRDGQLHTFRDNTSTFKAVIVEVDSHGRLWLRKETGETASFAFKEVQYVI